MPRAEKFSDPTSDCKCSCRAGQEGAEPEANIAARWSLSTPPSRRNAHGFTPGKQDFSWEVIPIPVLSSGFSQCHHFVLFCCSIISWNLSILLLQPGPANFTLFFSLQSLLNILTSVFSFFVLKGILIMFHGKSGFQPVIWACQEKKIYISNWESCVCCALARWCTRKKHAKKRLVEVMGNLAWTCLGQNMPLILKCKQSIYF